MGFDWNLTIEAYVDPATGKPWIWSQDGGDLKKIPFNPDDWVLPEQFREFAVMRGHHLYRYIHQVEEMDYGTKADAQTLVNYFPCGRISRIGRYGQSLAGMRPSTTCSTSV